VRIINTSKAIVEKPGRFNNTIKEESKERKTENESARGSKRDGERERGRQQ